MRYTKNLITPLIALAVLGAFAVGVLCTLGVRSLVVSTASAQPSAPNPGHSYAEVGLPEGTWPNLDADRLDGYDASSFGGGGCYTNWNDSTCAPGWTAVSAGEWTAVSIVYASGATSSLICAAPRSFNDPTSDIVARSDTDSDDNNRHMFDRDPCAICCK